MSDLFDRTARQKQCIKEWLKNKLHGTVVAPTGVGKTRIGLLAIQLLKNKFSNLKILVVVPTEVLQSQWEAQLDEWGLSFNCEVQVINTVIKHNWQCDMLVLDECHRYAASTFKEVFERVDYKYVLGLTATFERLDGKEEIIKKYCPVCDEIYLEEALFNNWISQYKEYMVLLNVDNIEEYQQYNREFSEAFGFFSYDFNMAMSCVGPDGWRTRNELAKQMARNEQERGDMLKKITIYSMQFTRSMQKRKAFINNHPKKVELARKIIEAYPDKKIITFSNNIKTAEAIQNGENVYSGKVSKKKGRIMIEDYNKMSSGVLNTIQKANEGLNVPGISIAIVLGLDSSSIKARQRLGRAVRFTPGKQALIFNLIINHTVETEWFLKSHKGSQYTVIDESELDKVFRGEEPKEYKGNLTKYTFRF